MPSTVSAWNELNSDIRSSPSPNSFKNKLASNVGKPPAYYYSGHRKAQIYHTRLRTNCSNLNLSLFQKNIVESPLCRCGDVESSDHFLLRCPLYRTFCDELINITRPICTITTEVLLFGNPNLTNDENIIIFEAVRKYISSSKRFEGEIVR